MTRWIMIIDVAKCENCNNCFLACKDEHCGNDWPGYSLPQPLHGQRWMNIHRRERGQFPQVDVAYLPQPCLHCDDAPCMRRITDGTIGRRPDGIVLIDPPRAKGRREIQQACPFGAIWWNDELRVAQKCTFCAHLLDGGWKAPRCVQACPTGALNVQRIEPAALPAYVEANGLALVHPEHGVRSGGVYYRNLQRFSASFVAGSVAIRRGGVGECLPDALVTLLQGQTPVARQRSDAFGDFKFDGLPDRGSGYRVRVEVDGGLVREMDVPGQTSCALGTIWL